MATQKGVQGILPVIIGLGFCYLLFNPPAGIRALGIFGYLIPVALLVAAVLMLVMMSLRSNLPEHLSMVPAASEPIPAEMQGIMNEIQTLGFHRIDPPLIAQLSPGCLMVGFVNEEERIYSTVYKTLSIPAKISFDYVSTFMVQNGGLTTSPSWEGGTLPAPPGGFKQIFPGETPTGLFHKHKEAMAFLKRRNVDFMPVSPATFDRDFRASFKYVRSYVMSHPISSAWIALWRTITKQNPHIGSIQSQNVAKIQAERLRA